MHVIVLVVREARLDALRPLLALRPSLSKQDSSKSPARIMPSAWPHVEQYMLPQPFSGSKLHFGHGDTRSYFLPATTGRTEGR